MVIFAGDLFEDKFQTFPTSIGEGSMCELWRQQWQHPVWNTGYLDVGEKHVHDMYDTFYTCVSLPLCGTLRWDGKHIDILQSQTIWTKNRIVIIKDRNGCEFKVFFCSNTFFGWWGFQSLHPPKNLQNWWFVDAFSVFCSGHLVGSMLVHHGVQ